MYRRQNQSQHLKSQQPNRESENENPAYDRQSVYDDIIELDQERYGPYDVPDDGACYDELKDPDKDANETYDHPEAVPGPSMPTPYEGLNATNTTHNQPDAGPALPDRPTLNPSQDLNQETTKPTTAPEYLEPITTPKYLEPNTTPDYLLPNTTPAYLELTGVDDEQNQTTVYVEPTTTPVYLEPNTTPDYLEPTTTPDYLELIDVDEGKNQTTEC